MAWSPGPSASAAPAIPAVVEGGIWVPPAASRGRQIRKAVLNIVGPSGVGKSTLVWQLCEDPDYGPDEVLVLMHEEGRDSYGPRLPHIWQLSTIASAEAAANDLLKAAEAGRRLPKALVWDSLTGASDYTQKNFRLNPNMVFNKETNTWSRDKRSEYGDLGADGRDIFLTFRMLPMDVIVLVTSHEDPYKPQPEIACEGKLIPKNLTRWSSATLYMRSKADKAEPAEIAEEVRVNGHLKHRNFGKDANGNFDGTYISRFFTTQNTGEIVAKGHASLSINERAILPDVLRKIHNWQPESSTLQEVK